MPTNLEAYRKLKGITQMQLATKVVTQQPKISLLENNEDPNPDPDILEAIALELEFKGHPSELLEQFDQAKLAG